MFGLSGENGDPSLTSTANTRGRSSVAGPMSPRLSDWEVEPPGDDRVSSCSIFSIFSLGSSFCSFGSTGLEAWYGTGCVWGEAAAPSVSDPRRFLSRLSSEAVSDSTPWRVLYWKSRSCSCTEPAVVGVRRRAESWPTLVAALVAALLGTVLLVLLIAPVVGPVVDVVDRGVVDGTMTLRTQSSKCS